MTEVIPMSQQLTQQFIDELIAAQIKASPLRSQELNPAVALEIAPQLPCAVTDKVNNELRFMLASVPKVGIFLAQEQALADLPDNIAVNQDILIELLGREPERVMSNTIYADIANWLADYLPPLIATREAKDETLEHKLHRELSELVNQNYAQHQLALPKAELAYHVLTLSSNSATKLIKELSPQYADYLKQLAPNYEPLATTDNYAHWLQQAPNVGLISEFAKILDNLVTRYIEGKVSEFELTLLQSMRNNKQDFGHCFTNSELGLNLQAQSWEIYEKTGYYPCVYWVQATATLSMHMVLATICTVYDPATKQKFTFHHRKLIAVAYPHTIDEKVKAKNGLSFPDEWAEGYVAYSKAVKSRFNDVFRTQTSQLVSSAIKYDEVIIPRI